VSFICGGSSPHQSEQQQQQLQRPSVAGALPGLCFAFFHLSLSNKGPEKELVAATVGWIETDGTRTTGQMPQKSKLLREECSTKAVLRSLLILPPP